MFDDTMMETGISRQIPLKRSHLGGAIEITFMGIPLLVGGIPTPLKNKMMMIVSHDDSKIPLEEIVTHDDNNIVTMKL